jgi:MOSC domain-containing protein YiiM
VVLQISQGRQPCWKLNLKFDRPDMAWLVQKTGRTGWYYRVLKSGGLNRVRRLTSSSGRIRLDDRAPQRRHRLPQSRA